MESSQGSRHLLKRSALAQSTIDLVTISAGTYSWFYAYFVDIEVARFHVESRKLWGCKLGIDMPSRRQEHA